MWPTKLEKLEKYRHAVNGDALHKWSDYFDIGKAVYQDDWDVVCYASDPNAPCKRVDATGEKGMMIYFLHGFGVFLGVLAGTVVTILTQLYFAKRGQIWQTQNLKFELELNVSKIDTCLRLDERMSEWIQTHKPDAVESADFWQKDFCDHRMKLKGIIGKL